MQKKHFSLWHILIFFVVRHGVKFWLEVPVVSCTADQPLVQELAAPADDVFDGLLRTARGLLGSGEGPFAENQLSDDTFANSRGFVLRFNRDGAATGAEDEDGAFAGARAGLRPFFDLAKDDAANAFVLNVLVCGPDASLAPAAAATAAGQGPGDTVKTSVGLHVDNTLGIESSRKFLHTACPYYI